MAYDKGPVPCLGNVLRKQLVRFVVRYSDLVLISESGKSIYKPNKAQLARNFTNEGKPGLSKEARSKFVSWYSTVVLRMVRKR